MVQVTEVLLFLWWVFYLRSFPSMVHFLIASFYYHVVIIPLSTVQEVVSNLTAIMKHWCCATAFLRLTAQVCILLLREISRAAELCLTEVVHLVCLQNFRLTYVCVSGSKKCWFFPKFCGRKMNDPV